MTGLAHAEDGSVIESEGFPFEEIFARDEPARLGLTDAEIGARVYTRAAVLAVAAFQEMMRWVGQNGMNNESGLVIRVKLACFNVLPEYQESYNLTELAGETEQDKQSFGRWQDDFKLRFPDLINPHMRK